MTTTDRIGKCAGRGVAGRTLEWVAAGTDFNQYFNYQVYI